MGPRTLTPDNVTCAFRTCRPVTRDTTAANASLFGSRVPALKHSRRMGGRESLFTGTVRY